MLRPRFFCAPISVICLMLVVPDVETMVLPLRSSTVLRFADFFEMNRLRSDVEAEILLRADLGDLLDVGGAGRRDDGFALEIVDRLEVRRLFRNEPVEI